MWHNLQLLLSRETPNRTLNRYERGLVQCKYLKGERLMNVYRTAIIYNMVLFQLPLRCQQVYKCPILFPCLCNRTSPALHRTYARSWMQNVVPRPNSEDLTKMWPR